MVLKGPLFAWSPDRDLVHVSTRQGEEKGEQRLPHSHVTHGNSSLRARGAREVAVNLGGHRQRLCEDPRERRRGLWRRVSELQNCDDRHDRN